MNSSRRSTERGSQTSTLQPPVTLSTLNSTFPIVSLKLPPLVHVIPSLREGSAFQPPRRSVARWRAQPPELGMDTGGGKRSTLGETDGRWDISWGVKKAGFTWKWTAKMPRGQEKVIFQSSAWWSQLDWKQISLLRYHGDIEQWVYDGDS